MRHVTACILDVSEAEQSTFTFLHSVQRTTLFLCFCFLFFFSSLFSPSRLPASQQLLSDPFLSFVPPS